MTEENSIKYRFFTILYLIVLAWMARLMVFACTPPIFAASETESQIKFSFC